MATRDQRDKLAARGIDARLTLVKGGLTVKQFAAAQAADGFQVWRSWDEPGGFRDQMYAVARDNPQIAKLVRLGTTIQGREILAIKLTQDARSERDGRRPAVLYSSTQHAREWISGRGQPPPDALVHRPLARNDKQIRRLLNDTELWFVLIANPDGYEYTFDVERLWRKNLRDNDGNGEITVGDGVDPNRNFPNHFKYDEEGSSSILVDETYRGPGARVRARDPRAERPARPHRASRSRSTTTPPASGCSTPRAGRSPRRRPTTRSTSRCRATSTGPRSPGFHPGLSSDVLYVTNGETDGLRARGHGRAGVDAGAGRRLPDGCGFVFPDDEAAVQAEFERNLPFALSVAELGGATRTTRSPRLGSRPSRSTSAATTRTRPGSRARTSRSGTPTATRSRCRCWPSAASAA